MSPEAGKGPGMTPQGVNAHIDGVLADPSMPTEQTKYGLDYDNAQVDKIKPGIGTEAKVTRVAYGRGNTDRHLEGRDNLITGMANESSVVDTSTDSTGASEVTATTYKKSDLGTYVEYDTANPNASESATVSRESAEHGSYEHTFKDQDTAKALITALATKRATRAVQNSVQNREAA